MGDIALAQTGKEELPARVGLFFHDQDPSPVSRRPQGAEESGRPAADHDERILFHYFPTLTHRPDWFDSTAASMTHIIS
jgi:hypothetical protein